MREAASGSAAQVQILDMTGCLLYTQPWPAGLQALRLAPRLQAGSYTVSVRQGSRVSRRRWICYGG